MTSAEGHDCGFMRCQWGWPQHCHMKGKSCLNNESKVTEFPICWFFFFNSFTSRNLRGFTHTHTVSHTHLHQASPLNTSQPSFPLRFRLYYCYLLHFQSLAPWESRLKLLFAVTSALCFLLRWSHFVLETTALFQTTGDRQGLTPASWQDRCCAGAHLYFSFITGFCPQFLSNSLHIFWKTNLPQH